MYICKNCGDDFSEKYSEHSNLDFCSIKCARSYSTKNDDKSETKLAKCVDCKKEITINKRASIKTCKCGVCKNKRKNKKCNYCGSLNTCPKPVICRKYRVIPTLVKYFGFDSSVLGSLKYYEEFERIKNKIHEDYWDNAGSIITLCDKYSHKNYGTFLRILRTLDIDTRNYSDGIKNSILQGRSNPCSERKCSIYKHGWHETWDKKKVFYRSSYELEFAIYLDENKISYEMEALRILYWDSKRLKQRVAIPDFYLPDTNEIIEIKGTYTFDKQNMSDKFKAYKTHGYTCTVILNKKEINFIGD